ncbi:MAG: S-layer protein [Candidatus Diapherotrites archaeon]|nr:S-layer protein [Candidatus Diapherotrites archaeon]
MKGLSVKKVAAVAAGVALVGSAFAPIVSAQLDLQKSDVFNDNGTPKVKIVVGSNSLPSDGVWAGNIAAAIAEQARVYRTVSVSGAPGEGGTGTASVTDLSAKLVIGGTVSFDNAKSYKSGETSGTSDMNSDTTQGLKEFSPLELTDSALKNLKNEQRQIKWNGNNYTRTIKEIIGIRADALFDFKGDRGAADLELTLDGSNDVNYAIDLGSGIPVYESTSSTTKFTDGTNDNIKIPFFGEEYLVREVDKSNDFIRLIKDQGKLSFVEGDIITGLKGKNSLAGQDVSVKVESVTAGGPAATTYSAKFILIDAEGNEVNVYTAATGESLNEQFVGSDGKEALETLVYLDSISVGASSGVGTIDITIGTTLLDLYSGKGYPYDSSNTTGQYDYKTTFSYSSDGNYVTRITIGNDQQRWTNSSGSAGYNQPLYAPDSQALTNTGKTGISELTFLSTVADETLGKNFFSIDFQGFESDEPLTTIKFTGSGISYRDASDRQHNIPYYILLSKTGNTSFTFDGKTIYYKSNYNADATDLDVNTTNGGAINGVKWLAALDANLVYSNFKGLASDGGTVDVNAGNSWSGTIKINNFLDVNGMYGKVTDTNVATNGAAIDRNGIGMRLAFDGNITLAKATINSSTASSDYLISSWTGSDGNTHRDFYYADSDQNTYEAYTGAFISLQGADDVAFKYALFSDRGGSSGDLYLLLAGTASGLTGTTFDARYDADFKLLGTDLEENTDINAQVNPHGDPPIITAAVPLSGPDRGYYWPDLVDMGEGSSAETFYVATFSIETTGSTTTAAEATADYDTNFYINTGTHLGLSFPNTNLSGYSSDINFNMSNVDGAVEFGMDEDTQTTTKPSVAYNDTGGKMEVSGGEYTFVIPDAPRRVVIVVKTEGTTTTTTGGETLIVAEGDTGTTEAGTQITVEEVTYSASCTGAGGREGTCSANPKNYFEPAAVPEQMVFLDTEAPSGALVLVGGHMVNRLSAQISNIRDLLTAPGDGKDPWRDTDTGNWVVAGYTKDDTVASARAFIAAVEDIDMMG